jgi:protein-tyrosine phosphatase
MIDMHSHILFNVDDGPKDINESLELLQLAVQEGITEIISTSHVLHHSYQVEAETVINQTALLQHELNARNIPLKIHTGHEIRISEDLVEQLQQKKILPLGESRYVLVEFPSSNIPSYTKTLFNKLQEEGYTPIIAHPERNKAIAENPKKLYDLIINGALAQITAGSLAGHFGKAIQKTSIQLVEANLVHTYGSDVHNAHTRPFLFDAGLTALENRKLLNQVDILLENNARIITNDEMIIMEPQLVKEKKWWNIF